MHDFSFLSSKSGMAGLISRLDWSETALGPVSRWPQSVRTTVALILHSPVAIVTLWGEDGVMIYNDAYARFAGTRHPGLLGSNVRDGWPEVADFNDNVMKAGLAGETLSYSNQMMQLNRTGAMEDAWLDLDYSPIIGEAGTSIGVMAIVVDTTDKIRAEAQLRSHQERLSRMFQQTPGFMAIVAGPGHVFEMANDAYIKLVGGRDVVGKPLLEAIPEVKGQGYDEMLDEVLASGKPFFGRGASVNLKRQPDAPVEERFVDFVCQPLFDDDGRTTGVFMQGNDVTEAKRLEADRQREAHVLAVLNRLGADVAAELDQGKVIQMITDAGVELTGAQFGAFFYNAIDEKGASYTLYALSGVPREAFSKFPMPRPTAIFRPTFKGEELIRSDDIMKDPRYGLSKPHHGMPPGHLPVRSYLAVPVVSRSGEILGGLFFGHEEPCIFQPEHETLMAGAAGQAAIALDNARLFEAAERELAERRKAEAALQHMNAELEERVSEQIAERLKMEEELRQSQKMEALGQLTGGVAHDFNNLLQVIAGNLQLLGKDVTDARMRRRIDNALAGVDRGSKLASQLLAFGRRQPLDPKVINIGRFIDDMEDMLRRAIGEAIEIETIRGEGSLNALVDPTQIQNALLNLAINARDAMDERGRLIIEIRGATLDETYARRHQDVTPGRYVLLSMTDTGSGMTPDVLEQAFEPFFSTKPAGKGTGLGLSMVYGFVKQSGGHIRITSKPGSGTTVRIYFPAIEHGEEEVPQPEAQSGPVLGGGETILVAEDDDEVRATVVELLGDLGYRILAATDASSALDIIEGGAHVDLLFTDVVMPGPLSSTELARRIQARYPDIAILFTSGYAENVIVHGGRIDRGVSLLLKPYTRESLARKMRQVLDGRTSAMPPAGPAAGPPSYSVLLVEDEVLISMATAGMLSELGHRVVETANADEALAAFSKERFDFVLTDLGLPGMPGDELARRIRALDPTVPIVFATGQMHEPDDVAALSAYVLHKPYDVGEIERAISSLTAGRAST